MWASRENIIQGYYTYKKGITQGYTNREGIIQKGRREEGVPLFVLCTLHNGRARMPYTTNHDTKWRQSGLVLVWCCLGSAVDKAHLRP